MKQSNVYLIPDLIPSEASIQDSCCVVIDVLRATTTMITALGNGAQSITPVLTVEVAREVARNTNGLLGGERDCVKLPGFDFGNSPAEYTAERVGGQNIIMTTTNGTRAIMACLKSNKTLIAAFANLSAVIRHIADEPKLNIICAGTNGEITLEDTLLAAQLSPVATRPNSMIRHCWPGSYGRHACQPPDKHTFLTLYYKVEAGKTCNRQAWSAILSCVQLWILTQSSPYFPPKPKLSSCNFPDPLL